MKLNKTKTYTIILVIFVVLIAAVAVYFTFRPKASNSSLNSFAQCLAQKGFTMYGAYWCPHCQNEKALFGDSFRYVNYVECTVETQKCTAAGIEGFPTWITPDGRKLVGEQSLQALSAVSGCELPK